MQPLWMDNPRTVAFEPIGSNIKVDVAIVGGGITGVTSAYLLKKAGLRVALLERNRIGCADTGHTTAHLTYVTDQRLTSLVADLGKDHAQAIWDAGKFAMEQIRDVVAWESIDCDFAWTTAYLHESWDSQRGDEREELMHDADLAAELGFDATFVELVPLAGRCGVQFDHQARFHPLKYLSALAQLIPGNGSYVFEHSEVTEIEEECITVHANRCRVQCKNVVIATHVPLAGKSSMASAVVLQSRLAAYNSYAVAARVPAGSLPRALFWDTSDPYYYLRVEPCGEFDCAIFGGEDHKTGQESDAAASFERLEDRLKTFAPEAQVTHRWSGQIIETNDGLPLIGETAERQFIATGESGNGMTYGTLAAVMARDAITGAKNPWRDLFAPSRVRIKAGAWDYFKENLDYPYYMIKDRLRRGEKASIADIPPGEGRILQLDEKTAVYRDPHGRVTTLSPVCPHMACLVHWNNAGKTWDCPCHGSRFEPTGQVIAGPAEAPLERRPADTV